MNIANLTKFLDSRGALIVDGPRPGGMYRAEFGFGGAGGDESRKGYGARGGEAATWPQPANRNTTQDGGANAEPRARRALARST